MPASKRPHEDAEEVASVRALLLARMAELLEGRDVAEAAAASPEATLLELGLTSATGMTLKGWVLRTLDAELTTFELLKQPLGEVVGMIAQARKAAAGVVLPGLVDPGSLPPMEEPERIISQPAAA